MPAKLRPWQKTAFWLGLLVLLIFPLINFNIEVETADYALILWAVVAAIYLYIGETALFAPTIYRVQDERF